jgi:hypothetical protein
VNTVIKPHASLRHQYQCSGGDNELAHGGQAKDRIHRHRTTTFMVGPAVSLVMDQLAIAGHQHDRTDQAALVQCLLSYGLYTGGKMRRRGVGASRNYGSHYR